MNGLSIRNLDGWGRVHDGPRVHATHNGTPMMHVGLQDKLFNERKRKRNDWKETERLHALAQEQSKKQAQ